MTPNPRPPLDPARTYRRIPLAPHQRHDAITPIESCFVLAHLGVPRVDAATWSVVVDGLVRHELRLDRAALRRFPQVTVEAFHECAGSPHDPTIPMRRAMNVVWGGVALSDILESAGVRPQARFLWSYGLDHGHYAGHTVDAYVKDLPLERVADGVLVATTLNGAELPPEHGFPARLLIPGFYGTNSVKWLARLHLAERRADGPFTTALYNDRTPDGGTRPVWAVAPESALVAPAPEAVLGAEETTIWGWAWAATGVAWVDVSTDGGASWAAASVAPRRQFSWQRFALPWRPATPGPAIVMARATDHDGAVQPEAGARNAIHRVAVTVAPADRG